MTNPSPQSEPTSRCPACDSCSSQGYAITADFAHDTTSDQFVYRRCLQCRSIFLSNAPAFDQIGRYYPAAYAQHQFATTDEPSALDHLAERLHSCILGLYPFLRLRKAFFSEMASEDVFLDYGCGAGEALDEGRKRGATTIGVDFVESLIPELQAKGHIALLATSDWAGIVTAMGAATRIRLNHSLEHVHDPRTLLVQVARAARPGCRLQLSVPNPEGLSAQLFRRNWWGLEAPRHLVLASAARISALLTSAGFSVTEVCTEPTAKDIARSAAIAAWRRGLIGDKATVRAIHRKVWALLPGLPLGMAATLVGRGDRLHIYAVRR